MCEMLWCTLLWMRGPVVSAMAVAVMAVAGAFSCRCGDCRACSGGGGLGCSRDLVFFAANLWLVMMVAVEAVAELFAWVRFVVTAVLFVNVMAV